MAKKSTKSEEPKKKKPISLNILEIAKRLQKLEETGGGGGTPYTLPTASADTKGGVKIGEGLTMNGEVLSATGGPADSAKRSDIATEFSTETSYTAGCFVYYEGKLYQFNADHSAGAWDPTDVAEANVTDQIVSNKSAIDSITANVKMSKLWENPNPTASFAAQNITLSSDDYDMSLWATNQGAYIVPKGNDARLSEVTTNSSDNNITARQRTASRTSDTVYAVGDCYYQSSGGARSTHNELLVPITIYGINITA